MEIENTVTKKDNQEPSLKDKAAKGFFWGAAGSIIQQVTGLIFNIFIVRILSPDDFGLFAMLAIFTAIANSIMDSGFSTALINKKTVKHEDYNAVFWFSLFIGIFLYIILFFAAPLIAKFYNRPILINLSRLIFISFIFSSLSVAHNAYLLKNIMVKKRSIIDVVAVFSSGIVGLTLALNGFVYWGLAIQLITQCLTSTFLRWYLSAWRPSFDINFTPLKKMFKFSIKILLTNIISQINSNLLSMIFGRYYGGDLTGYYSQGYKWGTLGTSVITSMINGVSHPVLIKAVDDIDRQKNILRKMIRFGAFISFPCLLGFAFIGKEFIIIMVGEKWLNSLFFFHVFCLWGSISFLWYLYLSVLLSHSKSGTYMWGMISLSFALILVTVCMSSFGIMKMTDRKSVV